jgi:hypothetical protein
VWNLCWNEILGIFTTFYSWVPSSMDNIDNMPFSFNREVSKMIGKLGTSNHGNDYSYGVTLSNNVMNVIQSKFNDTKHEYEKPKFEVANTELHMTYIDKQGQV